MVQPSTAPLVASTLASHRFLLGCTRFSSNRATVSGANSSLGHGAGGRGWPHGGQGGGPVQRGVPPGLQGQRARRHGRESPQRYACSRLARVVRWERIPPRVFFIRGKRSGRETDPYVSLRCHPHHAAHLSAALKMCIYVAALLWLQSSIPLSNVACPTFKVVFPSSLPSCDLDLQNHQRSKVNRANSRPPRKPTLPLANHACRAAPPRPVPNHQGRWTIRTSSRKRMSTQEGAGEMEKESRTTRRTGAKPQNLAARSLSGKRKAARPALRLRQRLDRARKRENRDEAFF